MRALLAAALAVSATAAQAQEAGSAASRALIAAAAGSDAFETMAATAALAQSRDADVRAYAQAMIADHRATSEALAKAAGAAGLAPPVMQVGADQAGLLAALGGVTGADFDKAYWRGQALAHRSALVTEEEYVRTGDAAPLRAAATAALPVIRAHLDTAERMAAKAGQ